MNLTLTEALLLANGLGLTVAYVKSLLSDTDGAIKSAKSLFKGKEMSKGDARSLLDELGDNLVICKMINKGRGDHRQLIRRLSTVHHDRLKVTDYDFNTLNRKAAVFDPVRDPVSLSRLNGKSTEFLIASLYEKIRAVRTRNEADPPDPMIKRLIANIRTRADFLLQHVGKVY